MLPTWTNRPVDSSVTAMTSSSVAISPSLRLGQVPHSLEPLSEHSACPPFEVCYSIFSAGPTRSLWRATISRLRFEAAASGVGIAPVGVHATARGLAAGRPAQHGVAAPQP